MNQYIKETLEKQLQILSERSIRERGEILPELTRVMISVAQYLDGESHETMSDLVAIEVNKQLTEQVECLSSQIQQATREIAEEELAKAIETLKFARQPAATNTVHR